MIIVKIEKGISLERALKLYKSKIIRTRQSSELNDRKTFEKKSVLRRKQIQKAIYRQKLNSNND
jgi:small subunit ribosomal protein S21